MLGFCLSWFINTKKKQIVEKKVKYKLPELQITKGIIIKLNLVSTYLLTREEECRNFRLRIRGRHDLRSFSLKDSLAFLTFSGAPNFAANYTR